MQDGRGVEISTGQAPGERGGHACKIAKWSRGDLKIRGMKMRHSNISCYNFVTSHLDSCYLYVMINAQREG